MKEKTSIGEKKKIAIYIEKEQQNGRRNQG